MADFGADRATRASHRAPAGLGHSASVTASGVPPHRLWDEMADALLHMDFPRFDSAMTQLRNLRKDDQ
jgi:hypothetical protein